MTRGSSLTVSLAANLDRLPGCALARDRAARKSFLGVSNSKVGKQSSTQTIAQSASVTTAYPKRVAGPLVNWLNAAADDSAPIVIHTSIGALFVFG
jgi:hypothetical protein